MNKTPKLRFKEFSGDWESKKLGDIIEYKKGYAFKSNNYKNEGVRIIKISDTSETSIKDTDITCISEDEAQNYKEWELKTNDIIVSTVGSRPPLYSSMVGKIVLIPKHCENTLLNQNLVRLRTNELSKQGYLYTYLDSKRYLNYIEGICRGNANQVSITLEDLFEYKVRLPKIKEQEKIASFFSLIDDKISLQGDKVEALKDYKKGMMQKIFSRELRFKDDDGRDYPEWEEYALGKLIKIKSNRNKNGEVDLVLSVSNTKGFITQSEQFEDRVVASSDVSNYKIVEKNDFAFNPARINVGSIARLKLYDKGIISPMYICFKCLDLLDSDYLEYFLMTHSFDVQMKKKLEGSVRQTLSAEALGEIVIDLPCIEEQNKIGEFLGTINTKLEKEQGKLDSLNEYKKGLLQQMFV